MENKTRFLKKSGDRFFFVLSIVIISVALVFSFSYAWFSTNNKVFGNNMLFSNDTNPNLVISDTPEKLAALKLNSSNPFEVSATITGDYDYVPCTHRENDLYYIKNNYDIDKTTGLPKSSKTLIYQKVDSTDNYYRDYTVYIGSCDKPFTDTKFLVSMENVSKSSEDAHSYKAASVDLYVDSVSAANYMGTANVAGKDIVTGNMNHFAEVTIPDDTVPVNTEGYVKIVMRFYFDGALMENSSTAYINTDTVSGEDIKINVKFKATSVSE